VGDDGVGLFAEFVALRSAALQRTAYLIAGEAGAAEELVREALTRTCLAWPRLRDPHRAEEFARAAIASSAVRRSERRRRRPEPPGPSAPVAAYGAVDDDLADVLWLGLSLLPARQRAVIVLHHHDELTEREIAEALRCGVRTVERELAFGVAELRRRIGADGVPREAQR
jgi:RNA polymerase sigma factor (sigma-70 family)